MKRCTNCLGYGIISYDPNLQAEELFEQCPECEGTGVLKVKVLMCDPPRGWFYGFPKPYTPRAGQTLVKWFLEQGYPQSLIDQGMLKYVRFWEMDSNKIDVV